MAIRSEDIYDRLNNARVRIFVNIVVSMQTNHIKQFLDKRIHLSIGIRTIVMLFVFSLLLFYLIWEIYWFQRTGIIKWHAHIMLYAYLLALGVILFRILGARFYKARNVTFSIWIGLFFLELCLMAWGGLKTYHEKDGLGYHSHYHNSSSYYHTGNKELVMARNEFTFKYPLNSLGFPDKEWSDSIPPNEKKRILALGDSFTFGDGASYGESYVSKLSKLLNENSNDSSYYVMNAGFCGSDPFFNYVNVRDRLWLYKPDLIIQSISSQDMLEDYVIRGGMERFLAGQQLKYKSAPFWEPLYASSYVFRPFVHLFGFNELLINENSLDKDDLVQDMITFFKEYVDLCRKKNIYLIVVIRPNKMELEDNKYDFDFSLFKKYFLHQEGMYVFDIMPRLKTNVNRKGKHVKDLYWSQDGHHNPEGYKAMADEIYVVVKPILDSIPDKPKL